LLDEIKAFPVRTNVKCRREWKIRYFFSNQEISVLRKMFLYYEIAMRSTSI